MTLTRTWFLVVAIALVGGCTTEEPTLPALDDPDAVRTWANTASSVAVFLQAYSPLAQSYGQPDIYADLSCPAISDTGTTLWISGGCTEESGEAWYGSARILRSGTSDRDLTLEGFGTGGTRTTGTVAVRALADGSHSFEVHIVVSTDSVTTIDYQGAVTGFFGDAATVWSGHGTVARAGGWQPNGVVTATTVDQRLDDSCNGEAVSGTTTLESEGHTVVVAYDGAVDCGADHSARWSFDGEDRGLVTGVTCAAAPAGAARTAGLAGLLLLGLAAAIARAARRR